MNHNYGTSKEQPEIFVKRGDTTQFRYNIREVTTETETGTETLFKYDYVEVPGEITYKKLVDAQIRAKYDVNDEFNVRNDKRTAAFTAYRKYVESCKTNAKNALE